MNTPYRLDPFFKWTVIIMLAVMISAFLFSCRLITGIERTDYHGGKAWTDKAGNLHKLPMQERKSFFK